MYKVKRLFAYPPALALEKPVLEGVAEIEEAPCPGLTEEEVIKNGQGADAIIVVYEPITKKVIDALPDLKLIAYKSIGFNSVDLAYATEKGIPVCHITQYCTQEVADYVMSCILSHNRRLFTFDDSVRNKKEWNFALCPDMQRLGEQTVGFVGFGNIPKLVAKRLAPYGCKLIAFDPFVEEEVMKEFGVEKVEKDEVFAKADYISCHLPLNPHTERSITKEDFDKIEDSAVFINSARGGVIVEEDLVEALDKGKVKAAYLDVLTDESPDLDTNPLFGRKDVILTPHIAFYSEQSVRDGIIDCAEHVRNFFEGNYETIEFVNKVPLK